MTDSSRGITATDLIAAATRVLSSAGYHQVLEEFPEWNTSTSRLFEDEYNVVGVVVFDTCTELLQAWPDRQGSLVEVISQNIGREESKSWDGYLVLMTPGIAPSEETAIESVRYNTSRVRKVVATGTDLRHPADMERVLRALLPLPWEDEKLSRGPALDLLPKLLSDRGIAEEITRELIEAFRDQAPLLERLHKKRTEQ